MRRKQSIALLVLTTLGSAAFPARSFSVSVIPTRSFDRCHDVWTLSSSSADNLDNLPPTNHDMKQQQDRNVVPITLLTGFLGSGKTCTLQHLLQNAEGVKIGAIVNDVAAVNIDAQLIDRSSTSTARPNGIMQLQNGCACCSLADELLTSVQALLQDSRQPLDAVVVELSGVADPMAIKSNWQAAKSNGHPVTQMAEIANIVTLIDASTFGTNWMSWDMVGDRDNWVDSSANTPNGDDCAANRHVPELLAEQVEAANTIVINKKDLAGPEQVEIARALARTLNQEARMESVEFGRVLSPSSILQHFVPTQESAEISQNPLSSLENDEHDKASGVDDIDDMSLDELRALVVDLCGNDRSIPNEMSLVDARDFVWDIVLDHGETEASHHHDHEHKSATSTSIDNLDISSFVYKADRPFHLPKLLSLLEEWPIPNKDALDLSLLYEIGQGHGYTVPGEREGEATPFRGVLRSKGFCWFAPTRWHGKGEDSWRHDAAMYWSNAGKHFGISVAGKWWDTVDKEQMQQRYFQHDKDEYERVLKENFLSAEFGDRRQELVFIGVNMNEDKIRQELDRCLVTASHGMQRYQQGVEELRLRRSSSSSY